MNNNKANLLKEEKVNMPNVDIYTDGACSGNPGVGGWCAILKLGKHSKEISGSMPSTTNNRMEMFAAISGLGALKYPCKVNLYSDSAYLVNAFEKGWLVNWQKNGWKTSNKQPVENQDLWRLLLQLTKKHDVKFHKVKGHSDHVENNQCDKIAKEEIQKYLKLNES